MRIVLMTLVALALLSPVRAEDAEGCKDPSLIPRFPGSTLTACDHKDYDEVEFSGSVDAQKQLQPLKLEGSIDGYRYDAPAGKSSLFVGRNYENAIRKAGGRILVGATDANFPRLVTGLFEKKGQKTYVVMVLNDADYEVKIVSPKSMDQVVEVNADALMDELGKSGHVAVYGINFETGKSTITEDSGKVLEQVAKLLEDHADLKLRVEGHTDNQGKAKANLELSKKRAAAVKEWLVGKGIDPKRLTTAGLGDQKPVAANDSDEGRAKNRRVELVKL